MEIVFREIAVCCGERQILSDVSGVASPGRVLAVMGPSGCGKTTLLNCLAGRTPLERGEITMDGMPVNKSLRRKLSYVLQEDSFFPNLTLRETLSFTTMLRLPDKMAKKDKIQRMEKIIDDLDIRKCQNTIMGDALYRGISGGEKKRASIACELITDPAIIFLDEPTSGLDYSTASSLVRTLRTITEAQRKTLIMTIHQPSSQMFFTFHDLLLLSDGQVAYFGKCGNVIDFFRDAGIIMDPHYNPADFIIEKLKEDKDTQQQVIGAAKALRDTPSCPDVLRTPVETSTCTENEKNVEFAGLSWRNVENVDKVMPNEPENKISAQATGTEAEDVHVSLLHLDGHRANVALEHENYSQKWPTGWLTQYSQLTMRTFRQSRARILSKLKILESVLLCLMVSLAWFQLPHTEETLRDRMGVLYFTTTHWGFTPLFDAVSSFPMERVIIHKERSAGWYRLSAYYVAKMTSELPLILVQPAIFVAVSYWCIGFNGVGPFFGTIFVIMVNAIAGQSIGLFLGIACMDFRKAMAIATIIMMTMMLLGYTAGIDVWHGGHLASALTCLQAALRDELGGFFTRNLPFWLDWIKYLSFLHFTFHAIVVLEFTNAPPIQCAATANASQFTQCLIANSSIVSSEDVLKFYKINPNFWCHFLPLLLFIGFCRLAGYLVLRFVYQPLSH